MATLNLRTPNGYDGSRATTKKQGITRLATAAEALAGTANNVAVTPAQIAASGAANFASPPVLGYGSTTPRPVAATTLTTTSTITSNGNIVKNTAGNKDVYTSVATTTAAGANSAGTVTLVAGTATVATTAVTANSQIRLYRQGIGATGAAALGILSLGTKTAGTSFVINAVTAAAANVNQTTDVSVIGWEIVN